MLVWTPDQLRARRAAIEESEDLRLLRDRLLRLLEPLRRESPYFPDVPAMLSQDGGVCPADGARLRFDPLQPHAHRCLRCGATYDRDRDHRAWVWRYHLWLSERAIHLALLANLVDAPELRARAAQILGTYAARYREFANEDNVLGPSRLFFSTYLESIWLVQIVVAAALLEAVPAEVPGGLRATVEESAGLIASFDEGWSNRQVWNNAALGAAGAWLGDTALLTHAVEGPHGLLAQLRTAVTSDGLWFEGENYHFFALRGFTLAAKILQARDIELDRASRGRLAGMFVAPLNTLLPDMTLPARGDAPYGVSVQQPRFAELWELGRTLGGSSRVDGVLSAIYATDAPSGPDIGLEELAEQETNRPPVRIVRGALGWKALMWMVPDGPENVEWASGSCLLKDAGVAVLRSSSGHYASLECGGHPGGHGHPDLLHISLHLPEACLVDPGTGSYVDERLAWYRSTRAHNAPSRAGEDQRVRIGRCDAFDVRGPWSWVQASAADLFGVGTTARRSVVLGERWVLDVVDVMVASDVDVELPLHPVNGIASEGQPRVRLAPSGPAEALVIPRSGEVIVTEEGPAPPDLDLAPGAPLRYLVRKAAGPGRWVQLYAFDGSSVVGVTDQVDGLRMEMVDGAVATVRIGTGVCTVTDPTGTTVALGGAIPGARAAHVDRHVGARTTICVPRLTMELEPATWEQVVPPDAVRVLEARHYRRSERPYDPRFNARIAIYVRGCTMGFAVHVRKPDVWFRPPDQPDPMLDNEVPDIHSDGIQCYVGRDGWRGWLVVPILGTPTCRVHRVGNGPASGDDVTARWAPTLDGYAVTVEIVTAHVFEAGDRIPVNLVINEMYAERQRRTGQLVLSGGGGWTYLRGDREHEGSAAVAEVA